MVDYVYDGNKYYMFKTKISKSGNLYTGLETGDMKLQNFTVKKVDKNFLLQMITHYIGSMKRIRQKK